MHSTQTPKSVLTNPPISIKIKLSALWASVTLCYLYGDYFELYVPGKAEGLVNGVNMLDTPLNLFIAAVLLAIPALMVFLSVLLRPNINRILNIVFAGFFTAVMLLIAISSLEPWRAFYVFYAIVECILTTMIIIYALKWPREN